MMADEEQLSDSSVELLKDLNVTAPKRLQMTKFNSTTGQFICISCASQHKSRDKAHRHYREVHLNLKPLCKICGISFPHWKQLSLHKAELHTERSHCCNLCTKKYTSSSSLKAHIDQVHNLIRYKCSKCGKLIAAPHNYKLHLINCGKPKRRRSNKSFQSQNSVDPPSSSQQDINKVNHLIKYHFDPVTKSYSCTSCDKTYKSAQNAVSHYHSIHLQIKYNCKWCKLSLASDGSLRKHQIICSQSPLHEDKATKSTRDKDSPKSDGNSIEILAEYQAPAKNSEAVNNLTNNLNGKANHSSNLTPDLEIEDYNYLDNFIF